MRILHLLTALGPGGAETWLLNMLRHMDRERYAMDFCVKLREGPLAHVAEELGARVYLAKLTPSHVGYVRELRRILREGRYDIVHSHEFAYSAVGVWTAQRLGVPVICTFHHWRSPAQLPILRRPILRQARAIYAKLSQRYGARHATYVTALSSVVMSTLRPDYRDAANCRLLTLSTIIPPALSADERAQVLNEIGVQRGERVILHAGRFIEQKNHPAILDVFERVRRSEPSVRLVLLGQGPLVERVLADIERRGLASAVIYLGVRDDVVERLMPAADVFLFPSLNEGFGLAALEANAAGLPVVGTAIPGLNEAVVHGETALLHPVHDLDGMAASVLLFLRDPELTVRFGGAGRERARGFSHEAAAERLSRLYDECFRRAKQVRT